MRGRHAPSPTGRLHLGNARTALLAWLQVRAAHGQLVMRVEDVDSGRCRLEHEARMLTDLRWLGLDWDEGPDVGGPYGPYRQSERSEHYTESLARLETYPCTCTRRELREATPAGREPIYPGTCRTGVTHPERPAATRWAIPPGDVVVTDLVYGELRQNVATQAGDLVLRRTDRDWTYQLAVVVDDAAMAITHVLRGADLLDSTPRQVLLHRTLGHDPPAFAHVPLILGPDGIKLSKRHQAPDLSTLREGGADPTRVVALLAQSLGLLAPHHHRIHPEELTPDFDITRITPHSDTPLDLTRLR